MARPISWLPRLNAIRDAVSDSIRSHYDSADLQRLFEVQPRSAQMLLGLVPTQRIGKSHLVQKEELLKLLDRLAAAEDPARELSALKERGKPPMVRRKLRALVQKDVDAALSNVPDNIELSPGQLVIRFRTVEELAATLLHLAEVMQGDLDGFADLYELPQSEAEAAESRERALELADAEYFRNWPNVAEGDAPLTDAK